MKFLDQARFAQARLADDHDQLAVALPRSLPASHHHCHLVVAPNKWRKLALSGPASTAARTNEPVQNHLLGYALEGMRAALFGDKKPSDLTQHLRRDQHRARLGQRLHPRRDVGDVAVNLSGRIDHRRSGFKTEAGGQLRLAAAGVLAVEFDKLALD
jgi:hypothetical protein